MRRGAEARVILAASVVLQLCLGAHYAWSVFAQELRGQYGFSMLQCQAIYSSFHIMFTGVMLLAGRLAERFGPRLTALAGSLLFSGAWFAAGVPGVPSFPSLLILIGFCGGTGVGLAYLCPIAVAQRWYPERKSVVTGIAVAGFGFGAFFLALAAEHLLGRGLALRDLFRLFGLIFLVLTGGASILLRNPAGMRVDAGKRVLPDPKRTIFSRRFLVLYAGMFAGLFAGLMVAGNLKPMAVRWGIGGMTAAAGVSLLAVFNGCGRILWGWINQRFREERSILIALLLQAFLLFLSLFAVRSSAAYLVFASLLGFNYSATLVVFASAVSRFYGTEGLERVYPLLFTANAIAGISAPVFAGRVFDATGSYAPALLTAGVVCLAAGLLYVKEPFGRQKAGKSGRSMRRLSHVRA